MSADLVLSGLTKTFAASTAPALDDLSLTVAAGTCTAVLGPSGSGKSTLLRVIAGLESPDRGTVAIAGRDVAAVAAEQRGVGMVFQRSLLFPHLSVLDNVAFSDRVSGMPRARARERAERYLDTVRLAGYGRRRVGELSGGQEQRVAIARALAAEPAVLLLDEPFSALDSALRADMHDLLEAVRADVAPTILLVTHDRDEAARVADRVALVEHGRLLHEGTVVDAYRRPGSLRAAELMGTRNAVPGEVIGGIHRSALGEVAATGLADGPATLVFRQEDVRVGDRPDAASLGVVGTVEARRPVGARSEVIVRAGALTLHAEVPSVSGLRPGDEVSVSIAAELAHVVAG
ncbi:putative spermidine/putrescine transport system ATP-binding protein [Microbacterium hydrothermale]|uniref:ABC transporter ATP-binding protein n=2 Tax=Microbacterium TaxID=33882 RepID=UPI002225F569|nr:ABC transporter ATP-binding protein [Microbacterium hydrothermale]MCW2163176.1 putative spermidine/putrescine transport system ATP-binding protein [Microbacterium hydrothermale]